MERKIRTLLFILAFLSLFSASPGVGSWVFPYEYTFIEGPTYFARVFKSNEYNYMPFIQWPLLLITNLLLLIFPFVFTRIRKFFIWIAIVPALFLMANYQVSWLANFLPFAIVWIWILDSLLGERARQRRAAGMSVK